jgi:hypothetical protein
MTCGFEMKSKVEVRSTLKFNVGLTSNLMSVYLISFNEHISVATGIGNKGFRGSKP